MIEVTCSTCGSVFERRNKGPKVLCEACRLTKLRNKHKLIKQKKEMQAWKEVVELHMKELDKDYPEGLYSDPAESAPEEVGSMTSS